MRFLVSIPLPLLLILCSFNSNAIPLGHDQSQERGSSFKPRLIRSPNDSTTLASEIPDSESEVTDTPMVDWTLEQLEENLRNAVNKSAETERKLNETRKALKIKQSELVNATADCDEKKGRLDALTAAEKAKEEFVAADERYSTAETLFSDAEKELQRVKDAKTRIAEAQSEQTAQQQARPGLESEKKRTESAKNIAFTPFNNSDTAMKKLENDQKDENCKPKNNCDAIRKIIDILRPKLETNTNNYNTAKSNWETAKTNFDNCETALSNLKIEIAQLTIDSQKSEDEVQKKVDNAKEEKDSAEKDLEKKKAAKEKAEAEYPDSASEIGTANTDLIIAELWKEGLVADEDKLKQQLADLEKRFATQNERVGALRQLYQEKKKSMEPKKGNILPYILVPVLSLGVIFALAVGLFVFIKKRRAAAAAAAAAPSAAAEVVEKQSENTPANAEPATPPAAGPLAKKTDNNKVPDSKSASSSLTAVTATAKECNDEPVEAESPQQVKRILKLAKLKDDDLWKKNKLADSVKEGIERHQPKKIIIYDDWLRYRMKFGIWSTSFDGISTRPLFSYYDFTEKKPKYWKKDYRKSNPVPQGGWIGRIGRTKLRPFRPLFTRTYITRKVLVAKKKRQAAGCDTHQQVPCHEINLPWYYALKTFFVGLFSDAGDKPYPDLYSVQREAKIRRDEEEEQKRKSSSPVAGRMSGGVDDVVDPNVEMTQGETTTTGVQAVSAVQPEGSEVRIPENGETTAVGADEGSEKAAQEEKTALSPDDSEEKTPSSSRRSKQSKKKQKNQEKRPSNKKRGKGSGKNKGNKHNDDIESDENGAQESDKSEESASDRSGAKTKTITAKIKDFFTPKKIGSLDIEVLDESIYRLTRQVQDGLEPLFNLDFKAMNELLDCTMVHFENDKRMVEMPMNITFLGDIHGDYDNMNEIFAAYSKTTGKKKRAWNLRNFMFCGDYVDRGANSLSVITLLYLLKLRHPKKVGLIRGNHEDPLVNVKYGFHDELKKVYGEENGKKLIEKFSEVFARMPVCGLAGGEVFGTHGGLPSTKLNSLWDINWMVPKVLKNPADCPLANELLWNDPCTRQIGHIANSSRGDNAKVFGEKDVEAFCEKHSISMIVRGHQMMKLGYEFFAGGKLVTIFSAPNYCNRTNHSATINFLADGRFGIHVFIVVDPGDTKDKYRKTDKQFCKQELDRSYHTTKEYIEKMAAENAANKIKNAKKSTNPKSDKKGGKAANTSPTPQGVAAVGPDEMSVTLKSQ